VSRGGQPWRIISAPRSAIAYTVASVLFDGSDGMTEASTTRKPSMPCVFEDTMAAITNDGGKRKQDAGADMASHAVALREALRGRTNLPLTAAEQGLMAEWLNRLVDQAQRGADG
jgi:hypothetical protein